MSDSSNPNPPVDGAVYFYLSPDHRSIVVPDDDDELGYRIIARIELGAVRSVRFLLRQAELGGQMERLVDHYMKDRFERGPIRCPVWKGEESLTPDNLVDLLKEVPLLWEQISQEAKEHLINLNNEIRGNNANKTT